MTMTTNVPQMLNRIYDKLANEWTAHQSQTHLKLSGFSMDWDCPDCKDYSAALAKLMRAMDNE